MNARTNLWKACALALVAALALVLVATRESSWVRAHDGDEDDGHGQQINLWLPSTGIVHGETLRTTLTNFGPHRVTVRPEVVDADGVVVKQAAEPLILEPGQMRSFTVSRSEMGGGPALTNNGQSMTVRPAMTMRKQEARKMLVSVEVVDEATGSARFQAGGTCPPFACGTDSNHNETLVRDTSPLK